MDADVERHIASNNPTPGHQSTAILIPLTASQHESLAGTSDGLTQCRAGQFPHVIDQPTLSGDTRWR